MMVDNDFIDADNEVSEDDLKLGVRSWIKHQTVTDGIWECEFEYGKFVIAYHTGTREVAGCNRNIYSCECFSQDDEWDGTTAGISAGWTNERSDGFGNELID